jgi:hypothetical protein
LRKSVSDVVGAAARGNDDGVVSLPLLFAPRFRAAFFVLDAHAKAPFSPEIAATR